MSNNYASPNLSQSTQHTVEQGKHGQYKVPADLGKPFGEVTSQLGGFHQISEAIAIQESLSTKGSKNNTSYLSEPQTAEYSHPPSIPSIPKMDFSMMDLMTPSQQPVTNNIDIMNWQPQSTNQILSKPIEHLNTILQPVTGLNASRKNEPTASDFKQHLNIMAASVFSELKKAPLTPEKAKQEEQYHKILRAIKEHEIHAKKILSTADQQINITEDQRRTQEIMMQENIANRVSPSVDAKRKLNEAATKKSLAELLKNWMNPAKQAYDLYMKRQSDTQVTLPPSGKGKGKPQNYYGAEYTGTSLQSKNNIG